MTALHRRSSLIEVAAAGDPPERYYVTYYCRSLIRLAGQQQPSCSSRHQVEIYLHRDYPRRPPALKWLTDIFHPNILPPLMNGGVCIGWWSASETLDMLCLRIGEMLQFKSYSLNDPLYEEAAAWVRMNEELLPVDERSLL